MTSTSREMTPAAQKSLSRRLKGSFSSGYQTLLGITQGAAFVYLISNTVANFRKFDFLQWWLTGLTFLVLILVWYTISMETVTFEQLPSLPDSLIPFFIGAYEWAFVFTITLAPDSGLRPWLFGMVVGTFFQFLGFKHSKLQADKVTENKVLLAYLEEEIERRDRNNRYILVLTSFMALIGWFLPVGNVSSANELWVGAFLLFITTDIVFSFFYIHRYFQAVMASARPLTPAAIEGHNAPPPSA